MNAMQTPFRLLMLAPLILTLADCSCSSSGTTLVPASSFELLDPTPGDNNFFGTNVAILPNDNIIVSDPNDSSITTNNGAVHLYDPITHSVIASIYGDNVDDKLSNNGDESGITVLANGNFVIASLNDDVDGIMNSGSIILVDGTTGLQIGSTLAGDSIEDFLGSNGITALANNNFVIASSSDDENSIVDSGSVMLVDGTTGLQIGTTLAGDASGDRLGQQGITALANNNFVIASQLDDENPITNAGSVRLINGTTGVQIGPTLSGDDIDDQFGRGSITALANNNYVVSAEADDEGVITDAGSVYLMDGTTGMQLGTRFVGISASAALGSRIAALPNSNFVIGSPGEDEGGIVNSGSVILVDGSTGNQIGATLAGDSLNDQFGNEITALPNNNFVITSYFDDVAMIPDAGSVILVDGETGLQTGATLSGDITNDQLGSAGITVLANNNFVIASQNDDENTIVNAGSVRLINGFTGMQIGSTLAGDSAEDKLGRSSVTALANDNFVIASQDDDEGGIVDAGSIILVDGTTGLQIGSTLAGDVTGDQLGLDSVTALATNNFVVVSRLDDENSIINAGSARRVDGVTGIQIEMTTGRVANDYTEATITGSASGDFYITGFPKADNNGRTDSGLVLQITE